MTTTKQISNDVITVEIKMRCETHKELFRRIREAKVDLAINWSIQEARRQLNRAQQILEEQRQFKLYDVAYKSASHWIQVENLSALKPILISTKNQGKEP